LLFSTLALLVISPLQAEVPRGAYRGTAATSATYVNPNSGAVKTRRFSRKVTVTIAAPLAGETSPFNLNVKPTIASPAPVAGDFFTASARFVTSNGSPLFLQYWTFQNTGTGFVGSFTNSHLQEGFALDRLIAPLAQPAGPLKAHRFHDASVSPAFQVSASATKPAAGKIELTIGGTAFVPAQAALPFLTVIHARKQTAP
jgi:hypothetical protein